MHSTLAQAGVADNVFSNKSIEIQEIEGASLVRVTSLEDIQSLTTGPLELPGLTGQSCRTDPASLCLRPLEWMMISEASTPAELLNRVHRHSDPALTFAVNESDGLAIFRLSGAGVPWMLSKISSLDLLSGIMSGQHCTQTRMGHVAVLVHYHEVEEQRFVFDLIFDRSLARYIWDLLEQSAPHAEDLIKFFGDI